MAMNQKCKPNRNTNPELWFRQSRDLFRPKGQHGPVCRVMQNSEWKNWLFFTSCECNKVGFQK